MLQGARRMEGNSPCDGYTDGDRRNGLWQKFDHVARQFDDALRLMGVSGVIAKQVSVLRHHCPTPRCVDQDGFHLSRLDQRPPCIDIAPEIVARPGLIIEALSNGSAATRSRCNDALHADRVQHARSCCVDRWRHRWLNTIVEQQHLPWM